MSKSGSNPRNFAPAELSPFRPFCSPSALPPRTLPTRRFTAASPQATIGSPPLLPPIPPGIAQHGRIQRLLQRPGGDGRQGAQWQIRLSQHQIHARLKAVGQGSRGFGMQAWVLAQQALDGSPLLPDSAKPAAAAAIRLQVPLQEMAEQHPEPAHQLPVFLASQGFQFLPQTSPIQPAAVVIPQGGALLLHPAVEIALMQRRRYASGPWGWPIKE